VYDNIKNVFMNSMRGRGMDSSGSRYVQTVLNDVMNLQVPYSVWNILSRPSGKALPYVISQEANGFVFLLVVI
jgi:hypothetical protein